MESLKTIDERISEYDKRNSSNLTGFIQLLRMKSRGEKLPSGFYRIGKTGELLNRYDICGEISVSKYVLDEKRHSRDALHNLSDEEWLQVLEAINTPIAICRYRNRKKSYRVYTDVKKQEKNICVGLDINSIGRNIMVSNISTVFGRDVTKLGNSSTESVLYDKQKALEKSSSGHNPQIYSQKPLFDAKI